MPNISNMFSISSINVNFLSIRKLVKCERTFIGMLYIQCIRENCNFEEKYNSKLSSEIIELYEKGEIGINDVDYYITYSMNADVRIIEYFSANLSFHKTRMTGFVGMTYEWFYYLTTKHNISFECAIDKRPKSPRDK